MGGKATRRRVKAQQQRTTRARCEHELALGGVPPTLVSEIMARKGARQHIRNALKQRDESFIGRQRAQLEVRNFLARGKPR